MLKKIHLPERLLRRPAEDSNPDAPRQEKRTWRRVDDDGEFEALVAALRDHRGSVAKAAEALGINRQRAYRLLSAHPDYSPGEARRGTVK